MGLRDFVLAVILALVVGLLTGYFVEHNRFISYVSEQKGMAESQSIQSRNVDAQHKQEKDRAQTAYLHDLENIHDYYEQHPVVRVQYRDGACDVPKAADNPQDTHATAPGLYASPFRPEETESVAVRLNELQQLLIADGVRYE